VGLLSCPFLCYTVRTNQVGTVQVGELIGMWGCGRRAVKVSRPHDAQQTRPQATPPRPTFISAIRANRAIMNVNSTYGHLYHLSNGPRTARFTCKFYIKLI
jgi:hypothetical protein